MEVLRIEKEEWKDEFSENAHSAGFKKFKDASLERIDYALIAIEGDNLTAYMTCRELDGESIYWQFGASLGEYRHSLTAWKAFGGFVRYAKEYYKRASMLIENDNIAMLKMAWKSGFRCTGIRYFKDNILLEHSLEFGGNND